MSASSAVRSARVLARRGTARVARSLVEKVPRDHHYPDAVFRRRRRVVLGVATVGAGLLNRTFGNPPDSKAFYVYSGAAAVNWAGGSLSSGPLHLGWVQTSDDSLRRPFLTPLALGAGAFGFFYACGLVARHVPPLRKAITDVLAFSEQGSTPVVYLTTLANGAAEEVFFRGAAYSALGSELPVVKSTFAYALATTATRNPSLVLASGFMGTLFALQRRASGGIQAPMITHLTWSILMLRFLPGLFEDHETAAPDEPGPDVA